MEEEEAEEEEAEALTSHPESASLPAASKLALEEDRTTPAPKSAL